MGSAPKVKSYGPGNPELGTCWFCGAPMARHLVAVNQPPSDTACPVKVGDRVVISGTKVHEYIDGQVLWHVWLGDLGYDGNNTFCSLRCGYEMGRLIYRGIRDQKIRLVEGRGSK